MRIDDKNILDNKLRTSLTPKLQSYSYSRTLDLLDLNHGFSKPHGLDHSDHADWTELSDESRGLASEITIQGAALGS